MVKRPPIYLYTDGSAIGNPGPGGWGVVLKCGELYKELSGGEPHTTNNRMELKAVIEGLKAIKWKNATVYVWSDSSYVVNAVKEGWLEKWFMTDFKNKKNADLWLEYMAVAQGFSLTFNWLRGHSGHPENERCDTLALSQAEHYSLSKQSKDNLVEQQ